MGSPFKVQTGPLAKAGADANLIMVEYDPEQSDRVPFGDRIVLVQSVYRDVDGQLLLPSEFYGAGAGFDWKDATCLTDAGNRGMSVDALKDETMPYYNDSYGTATPAEVAAPGWAVGKCGFAGLAGRVMSVAVDVNGSHNTLRYAKTFVSRITDAPNNTGGKKKFFDATTNPDGWKTFTLNFKVFAFCSGGLDGGTWYEGVAWKFVKTSDDSDAGRPGTSSYAGELAQPDKDFLDAFALFNKKRTDADGFVKAAYVPPVPT